MRGREMSESFEIVGRVREWVCVAMGGKSFRELGFRRWAIVAFLF